MQYTRILLDCAVELPHKVPAYAALIGAHLAFMPDAKVSYVTCSSEIAT